MLDANKDDKEFTKQIRVMMRDLAVKLFGAEEVKRA